VRQELVKKIDENFLRHGSREELVAVILELLNVVHEQNEKILKLQGRVLDLENEVRILKGEKKSPSSALKKR
jgi:hypothetical protein